MTNYREMSYEDRLRAVKAGLRRLEGGLDAIVKDAGEEGKDRVSQLAAFSRWYLGEAIDAIQMAREEAKS